MGTFIFLSLGLLSLVRGIWMLRGGHKAAYFAKHLYAAGVYAQIPAGIGMIWLALASLLPREALNTALYLGYIGIGFGILAVLASILQPSFLKPAWLKWLERKHGRVMPILVNEAREMGLGSWQERVKTREGLEEWVTEVRRKHGIERKEHRS